MFRPEVRQLQSSDDFLSAYGPVSSSSEAFVYQSVLLRNSEKARSKASNSSLEDWIHLERWIDVPLVNYGNLYDIGTSSNRYLVLGVLHLVEKSKPGSPVQRLFELMQNVWRNYQDDLRQTFQFGWLDGNEVANNIVSRTLPVPSLMVLNVSSYQYFFPSDDAENITEESLYVFLTNVADGKIKNDASFATMLLLYFQPLGGKGYVQRVRRMFYELYITLYAMFANQPLLACCLIGLPLGILSVICYTICSTDVSFDSDEVYQSSDEEGI
ncbi:unnamed protein product [Soboliphyme baturini]|uniref:Rab-GAP TBC domain-containing protein n=1 Tax=Soboliphyme baturini TaxID=241478 RepID=A0A183IQS9_9BILA|nr:unnamed protein product [Soboliphyme baturini]